MQILWCEEHGGQVINFRSNFPDPQPISCWIWSDTERTASEGPIPTCRMVPMRLIPETSWRLRNDFVVLPLDGETP